MTTATLHHPDHTHARHGSWLGVAAILAAVAAVAVIGGVVTTSSVNSWYRELPKPIWTPPDWLFGPVWLVLYAMMAVAASLVWLSRERREVCCPLTAFSVQLGLNLAWSGFFFGLRNPLLGFLDICLLWVAIGLTVTQFFQVSRAAGWLMLPYWLWVTFAAALNAAIVLLGG